MLIILDLAELKFMSSYNFHIESPFYIELLIIGWVCLLFGYWQGFRASLLVLNIQISYPHSNAERGTSDEVIFPSIIPFPRTPFSYTFFAWFVNLETNIPVRVAADGDISPPIC